MEKVRNRVSKLKREGVGPSLLQHGYYNTVNVFPASWN